jgi:hypothetical protein
MIRLQKIVSDAEHWLHSIHTTEATRSLWELGLLLCDNIRNPENQPIIRGGGAVESMLTTPYDLITWDREKLMTWIKEISIADIIHWQRSEVESKLWSQCLGGLALSYAHEGDLSVVAAIVRVSIRLKLRGSELSDGIHFLMDQQQPDGSFGLLAREFILAKQEQPQNLLLRLTVEMLWAIDEVVHCTDEELTNEVTRINT